MRPSRNRTLTEKGYELLERNLRGKCLSALKCANTAANKLSPLLSTSDKNDYKLVHDYHLKFEQCVTNVLQCHLDYCEKFCDDADIMTDFNDWFQPRLKELNALHQVSKQWLASHQDVDTMSRNVDRISIHEHFDVQDEVGPDDSVSQVNQQFADVPRQSSVDGNGRSSHHSRVKSKSSLSSRSSRASVQSARLLQSLQTATLAAEASSLEQRQALLRKQFELGLEQEALNLSTKLAVAKAKEEVFLRLGSEGSLYSDLDKSSVHVSDSKGQSGRQSTSLKLQHARVTNRSVGIERSDVKFLPLDSGIERSAFWRDRVQGTDEEQVCDPLPSFNHAASMSTDQVCDPLSSSHASPAAVPVGSSRHTAQSTSHLLPNKGFTTNTNNSNTQVTMTRKIKPKLNPFVPEFTPRETPQHTSNKENVPGTVPNGAGGFSTHEYRPNEQFSSLPTRYLYDDRFDPLVFSGFPKSSVGSGGYVSEFGAVLDRLTDVLADTRNRLPEVVIPKFGGDPLEFSSFVRSFDSRIASHTTDDSERLNYLEQYTVGTAREIVRSCMHLPSEFGYREARWRLEKRFGDKFLLSQAYLKKLESWPSIRSDDIKHLDSYTTFLVSCCNAMTSSDAIRELDYPSSLRLVVSKLPTFLQDRWARLADKILYSENGVVSFARLVAFLEEETRIKLNPVFGKASLTSSHDKSSASKKKSTSAAAVVKKDSASSGSVPPVVKQDSSVSGASFSSTSFPCAYCSLHHSFERCRKFKKVLHKDKIAYLMQNKLCFDCFSKDHLKQNCPRKIVCDTCKGSHHTLLHRSAGKSNSQASSGADSLASVSSSNVSSAQNAKGTVSASTNTDSPTNISSSAAIKTHNHDTMPIIPVKLKLSCSDREILTYAFLDSGSSDTLITEETMTQLGADGKRVRINLETVSGISSTQCYAVSGLEVCGLNEDSYIALPVVYTQFSLPVSKEQIPSQRDIESWDYLSHLDIPHIDSSVGLLIGNNVPRATEPWDVINSVHDGPYAIRTLLGWCVNGPLRGVGQGEDVVPTVSVNRIQVRPSLEDQVQSYFNMDFSEQEVFSCNKALSVEDRKFLDMVGQGSGLRDGHYEICLPLRDPSLVFPNNRSLALQRMKGLKKKFLSNETFKSKYISFVDDLFMKGHASQVPEEELVREDARVWYLPHHGVFHPRKNKLRVVLDASARFAGTSLNDRLLPGPDLSNSIIGVLVRFRQERVAFMSDLECMFYQVKVPPDQRDLLRFLWWPNGDVEADMIECRMHAHIFGASSSPAVAKYALRRTALDNKDDFSSEAVDTVQHSFYVDDCLRSVSDVEKAISLASELRALASRGGFHLTQWVSNDRSLLASIPDFERAKNVKTVDLVYDELPSEKALGVFWSVETDTLGFQINISEKAATRRGIMSVVSSVYDPLGMAAPCVLSGKLIVQDLCRLKFGWDDRIPDDIELRWKQWLQGLPCLDRFSIPRCYHPSGMGDLVTVELHHFADASDIGYGCVTYLRMVDNDGRIHCAFVFGKSRVAPLKTMTIPRMELAAAVLAVKVHVQLQSELNVHISDTVFWSDSTSVLGYVKNEKARFHLFVANRVALIREQSSPSQWRYVPTRMNPADDASRGLSGQAFVDSERWRKGPDFLWSPESEWPAQDRSHTVSDEDPEVKRVVCVAVAVQREDCDIINRILSHFSTWYRLRRFVALLHRAVRGLRHSWSGGSCDGDPRRVLLNSVDLIEAEVVIVRWVQEESFASEMGAFKTDGSSSLPRSSRLAPLSPVLLHGVLRVGGRIKSASVPEEVKHPVILPSDSPVSYLIIKDIHENLGHGGREHVLSRLRERYWIVHANALTRKILRDCVTCRRRFRSPMQQRMADLPVDRLDFDQPPFTHSGVDYFGPVLVKRGRSLVKRYGALFTCLTCRAVHIEMAESLETSAFINVLRRFIARRGQVQSIRSDNGTNFVGAEKELQESIRNWNQGQIESYLTQKEIMWTFNAPGASHHGGVWERLIRSARRVMMGLTGEQVLSDDGLSTLFAEVEAILNSRPLTRSSSDPQDLSCLTPNHLLLLKGHPVLPPGVFSKEDNYVRRRWRQVQFLSDQFWKRWVREYLVLLQERQKWLQPQRNVRVGDIVLVVDPNASRGSWLLGRVNKTFPNKDGLVRSVELKTRSSTLVRPVSKLVLILECE